MNARNKFDSIDSKTYAKNGLFCPIIPPLVEALVEREAIDKVIAPSKNLHSIVSMVYRRNPSIIPPPIGERNGKKSLGVKFQLLNLKSVGHTLDVERQNGEKSFGRVFNNLAQNQAARR